MRFTLADSSGATSMGIACEFLKSYRLFEEAQRLARNHRLDSVRDETILGESASTFITICEWTKAQSKIQGCTSLRRGPF
jgi:hypothetical protein